MDTILLDNKFARIGARLQFADRPVRRVRTPAGPVTLDVQTDRKGEFFQIVRPQGADATVDVLDVAPADRHLLLLVRESGEKHKFLCGHDERHWFVAAIPESAPVGTVRQAKEALKPAQVQMAQARKGISGKARGRRKNAAYIRQGEWFFLAASDLVVDDKFVQTNEPLTRGNGGKPHWADFCYRTGGEAVYVCGRHPNGVTEATYQRIIARNPKAKGWGWDYQRIIARNPKAKGWGWRTMLRNPGVYVRGRIRHADHKTIVLHGWHQVLMNTESQAKAMRNVAFLD